MVLPGIRNAGVEACKGIQSSMPPDSGHGHRARARHMPSERAGGLASRVSARTDGTRGTRGERRGIILIIHACSVVD